MKFWQVMKRQSEIAYLPKWNANDDDDDYDNDLNYDIIYVDMQPTIQTRLCSVSESITQIKSEETPDRKDKCAVRWLFSKCRCDVINDVIVFFTSIRDFSCKLKLKFD